MARSILKSAALVGLLLFSVVGPFGFAYGEPPPSCLLEARQDVSATRLTELTQLQTTVESGVFYRELVRRLGIPESCRKKADGERLSLSYAFRGNARLEAQTNSNIEFSEQQMFLTGLTKQSALGLLKRAEKNLYGDEGCGIQWNHPMAEMDEQHSTSSAMIYKGNTCNCQARMVYEHKAIVGILVRSAC